METLRLVKRFAALSLLLLCVIGMVCGAATVRSNTRDMAFGEPGRQVGVSFDAEVTTITTDRRVMEWPALSPALSAARFAPAPVGTLLMFVDSFVIAH